MKNIGRNILGITLAVTGLTACAPPRGDAYSVELDMSSIPAEYVEAYENAVREGLADWSANVPVRFLFTEVPSCGADEIIEDGEVCVHAASQADLDRLAGPGPKGAFGTTRGEHADGGVIWLSTDAITRYNQLRADFEHELGHAMGLEHDPDPQTLMHWQVGDRVTPKDAAQWESLR